MNPEVDRLLRAPHGEEELRAFFEWRDDFLRDDGTPVAEWENQFIRFARMPAPLKFAGRPVHTIRVHRRLVERTEATYRELHRVGLWPAVETYAGAYNFRLIRQGTSLSVHAFGGAVDHDPARNPLGAEPEDCFYGNTEEGRAVVAIFEEYGWFWGGRFKRRKDCMHFQFATGY